MSLTYANSSVKMQRIILSARLLSYRLASRESQVIAIAYHEIIKRVSFIKTLPKVSGLIAELSHQTGLRWLIRSGRLRKLLAHRQLNRTGRQHFIDDFFDGDTLFAKS